MSGFEQEVLETIAPTQLLCPETETRWPSGVTTVQIDLAQVLRRFGGKSHLIIWPQGDPDRTLVTDHVDRNGIVLLASEDATSPFIDTEYVTVLTRQDLAALRATRGRKQDLAQLILRKRAARRANPYQKLMPVTGSMLFGRETELQKLSRAQEVVALLGPRRIGKTSLAEEFSAQAHNEQQRMVPVGPDNERVSPVAKIDCSGRISSDVIWSEIYDQIGVSPHDKAEGRKYALMDPIKRAYRKLNPYESLEKLVCEEYRHPLIILDEVGDMIDSPGGQKFFRELRGLQVRSQATVVLVGYDKLFKALNDDGFAFYRRAQKLILQSLSKKATSALVRDPMRELGVDIDSTSVDFIYDLTGGFPAHVQAICARLVEEGGPNSTVGRADVEKVIADGELIAEWYTGITTAATALARFLLYFLVHSSFARNPVVQSALAQLRNSYSGKNIRLLVSAVAEILHDQVIVVSELMPDIEAALESHSPGLFLVVHQEVVPAFDELMLRSFIEAEVWHERYRFSSAGLVARVLLEENGLGISRQMHMALTKLV